MCNADSLILTLTLAFLDFGLDFAQSFPFHAQFEGVTFIFVEPLVFGPEPRPAGYVDPDVIEPILFGPQPRPHGYVNPDFVEPIIFGPQPRPDNYLEPEDLDNILSMEDDTTHGGFEEVSGIRPAGAPPHTADSESASPSVAADKGKAPMPDLDILAEFLAEDAQARKRFKEEQASERLVQQLQAKTLAQEDLQIVSAQRAKELDELMMRMKETDWLSHNGTITMTAVKTMTKQQLIEEYEYICRRLEKDRLLSAQYNLFRPKPVISEPPSKKQRVDHDTSQPSGVPAASTHHADHPDSAGGGNFNSAGS
ncbi:hypothetical protein Tco_1560035 [Tanacetum coccineum]